MGTYKKKFQISFTATVLITVAAFLLVAYFLYPKPRKALKGKKPLVYWVVGSAKDEMKIVIEEFEKNNPEYHVQLGTANVRDATGDPTRFLLGVAGNVPPDLIFFDRFAVVEWASRGAFYPLDSMIEKDKNSPDAILKENFVAPAWNEAVYRGKTYAVPESVDTRALYYSKDALIRAGLVYKKGDKEVADGKAKVGQAKPPKTWEELCLKHIDAQAVVSANGLVQFEDMSIDFKTSGISPDDVITIRSKNHDIFRARVKHLEEARSLYIDLKKELPPGTDTIPSSFTGKLNVKIFDKDSYIVRLTRFDPETGNLKRVGFIPFYGNSFLYIYGWLNGGKFMEKDGTECTLDDPRIVEALQFVTDMYDSLGGIEEARIFQSSLVGSSILDPFLNEKITMVINGNWFMDTISAYKPNMNFGVIPPPLPEERYKKGAHSTAMMGGWAYAIPATAKDKEGAWKLMKWLASVESHKIRAEFANSLARSKGQVYFPRIKPDIQSTEFLFEKYIKSSPVISNNLKEAYGEFVKLLPYSKFRPVTPVGQKLWNEHIRAQNQAIGHSMTPKEALDNGTKQVQIALDRTLNPPTGPLIPWTTLIVIYCTVILCFIASLVIRQRSQKYVSKYSKNRWYEGYICAAPWLIGLFTFGVGPIFFSIIISFSHYNVLSPARFIGFENYANLLDDPIFWISIRNTCFMILSVPLGIVGGVLLALLLNHALKGMQFYRTLFYLPAIVPMVAALLLWMKIFDPKIGFINQMLVYIGVTDPPAWLNSPVWAKPSIIIMGLWGVGGSMVIWLAGLKNIPESLYEAAAIDGAGPWQRFKHITLPMLTPYIFFNLIMGMIGIFQIFEQAYIMTDGGPEDATLFYAYKLFNEAFRYLNFGVASAMAWFLFIVVLIITLINFWLGKKWVHYGD